MLSLFEAINQLFGSSLIFFFCIGQERKVVIRERVYWGDLWVEKEYSEFFVDLIHAQHIN